MHENLLSGLRVVCHVILGITFFWLSPTIATLALAGIIHGVIDGLGMSETWSWQHWVIFAPLIYISWLNLFLISCAIDTWTWPFLFGIRKHRRITTAGRFRDDFRFHLMLFYYLRERVVWHLPLTQSYMCFAGLRQLVLRATAMKTHIGSRSLLLGRLYDADLTEVGDGAVLGAGSTVTAHTIMANPDGTKSYFTAPVVIGPRVVIGGETRIDLGVTIGADAIVEPMSYVRPFTTIGATEAWGGNPARFLRWRNSGEVGRTKLNRSDVTSLPMREIEPADIGTHEPALRKVVAQALDRPLDAITPTLSAANCAAWDSLGQLGIAAGLQQCFGISLTHQESFRLRSMSDLRQLLNERLRTGSPCPAGTSR